MTERHVITGARTAAGERVTITVDDGRIAAVDPDDGRPAGPTTDLGDWLVLPPAAEPHAHLDKALTAEAVPNPRGDLGGAIEAWNAAASAGRFTPDDTAARARRAAEQLVVNGATHVRSHVNVGQSIGAASIRAVAEVRDELRGVIDLELVALVSSPLTGPDGAGNRAALAEALEAGADVVGGCPHLDPDGPGLIALALDAAADAGLPVDLHVDETLDPDMLTLADLARAVLDRGFDLPVTASHCVSLGMQAPARQAEVAALVAEAGVGIVTLPATNLFLQGREHPTATPRGLTAIAALEDAGVRLAAGADNVQDPFNPVGRSDALETAGLLVLAGHVLPDRAYELVSTAAREVLGLPPAGLAVGDVADFLAVDAPSVRAAIADAPRSRRTFRAGRLVASCDERSGLV